MSLPVEKQVRETLEPYNGRIRKVLDKAFKDFIKKGAANLYKRTDSADVFDGVIRAAIQLSGRGRLPDRLDGALPVRGQGAGALQEGEPQGARVEHPDRRQRQLPGSGNPVHGRAAGHE